MPELRFDQRVAVITGAGRGLGRAYALLLASRGARVVVNDTGASLRGTGFQASPAEEVVQAIKASRGEAVACTESVTTREGGKAIIATALDHFGRIDILIHSAGNLRPAPLKEMSYEDFDEVLDVHLRGAFHVVRPAFPLMCKAGYGRMVLTSSDVGLYGRPHRANYAASKAGVIGLSHVVALEGAAEGVKCNAICPGAVTRMAEGHDVSGLPPTLSPDMVAHAVGWLAHESCSITGEMLISVSGRVAKAFVAETRGACRQTWSIEQIGEQIDNIRNTGAFVVFPPAPSGHDEHLRYTIDMSRRAAATSPS
jgi:NAD(P)-dependent dehydrogenase (short-subunit alcohol dehydrogenase family)